VVLSGKVRECQGNEFENLGTNPAIVKSKDICLDQYQPCKLAVNKDNGLFEQVMLMNCCEGSVHKLRNADFLVF
jgi:hypothetical protein